MRGGVDDVPQHTALLIVCDKTFLFEGASTGLKAPDTRQLRSAAPGPRPAARPIRPCISVRPDTRRGDGGAFLHAWGAGQGWVTADAGP